MRRLQRLVPPQLLARRLASLRCRARQLAPAAAPNAASAHVPNARHELLCLPDTPASRHPRPALWMTAWRDGAEQRARRCQRREQRVHALLAAASPELRPGATSGRSQRPGRAPSMDTWEPMSADTSSASITESRWLIVKRPGISRSMGSNSLRARPGRLTAQSQPKRSVRGAERAQRGGALAGDAICARRARDRHGAAGRRTRRRSRPRSRRR